MDGEPPSVQIASAGVDWLTATAPADGRDWALLLAADGPLERERQARNEDERHRWRGYDLKTCGGVSAGVREDGAIVRLSGERAHEDWRSIAKRAVNISRLDLEVTVRMAPPDPALAGRHLAEFAAWREGRANAPKLTFHGTPDGVETLYVGSRASDLFGRIYDKRAESGDDAWADCWRYEVECKGTMARHLATALAPEPDTGRAVGVFVHDYFTRRGCRPVFGRAGGDMHVPYPRPRTTDETRLRWLTETVQPIVLSLTQRGFGEELARCLGLDAIGEYMRSEERYGGG
jgi:hypothetical protein